MTTAIAFPSRRLTSILGGISLATGWAVAHFSYTPVFIGFGLLPLVASAILVLVTCRAAARGGAPAAR